MKLLESRRGIHDSGGVSTFSAAGSVKVTHSFSIFSLWILRIMREIGNVSMIYGVA
jgi:hypothetical protein